MLAERAASEGLRSTRAVEGPSSMPAWEGERGKNWKDGRSMQVGSRDRPGYFAESECNRRGTENSMAKQRVQIPKAVRGNVLDEFNHRCAMCGGD